MSMSLRSAAEQLIMIAHRIDAKGLITATDGNISMRLPGGSILTTPTSMNKGMLTASDLVEVSADGTQISGTRKPSTEIKMHLFIYRHRPDVHAVVHCHPVHATAFAAAGRSLTPNVFPEVIVGLGEIPLAAYATPSTDALAESLAPYIGTHNAILLANHGAVTCGGDLWEACFAMEKLEQTAHILTVAHSLGIPQQLTPEQVAELKQLAATVYKK